MATARDVARRAGVSTSTVSHVINGTQNVSEVLRKRVLKAMRDLEYQPNAMARSLRTRRSHTLGLLVPDLANPFVPAVVRGIEDVAKDNDYSVILCNLDEDPEREREYLRVLLSRRVDGLLMGPTGERHEALERLVSERFPLVFFDRYVAGLDVSVVMLHNERAAHVAVSHLIELGHTRIGMVSGHPRHSTTHDRIAGYRHALSEAGLVVDERLIVGGSSTSEGAARAMTSLLAVPERPTAVFCANNLMTIGALSAGRRAGLSVPEELALVGFDDFSWADVFHPRLTTVAQPTYEIGRSAAELLLELIRSGGTVPPRHILLAGQLIVRESSGAPLESQSERTLAVFPPKSSRR